MSSYHRYRDHVTEGQGSLETTLHLVDLPLPKTMELPSNWQDEMQPAAPVNETDNYTVIPSTTGAIRVEVDDVNSGWFKLRAEEGGIRHPLVPWDATVFPSRDEIQPTAPVNETDDHTVIPSSTGAIMGEVDDVNSGWFKPCAEEGDIPMLRLPPDYIWSSEKESHQKHVDYGPYEGFGGREIIDEKTKTSKLGDGGFGSVRRVLCNGRLLARKEMRPQQEEDYDIEREVIILEDLVHRHIVELAGTYTQDGTLYILLYPVAECNLAAKLRALRLMEGGSHFEPDLLPAFGCLAGALAFVHSKEIAIKHKDIKPANILFYNGSVFLADWGLSNCFKDKENSRSRGWTYCTAPYAAPEVVRREERGTAQDIFSLGLVYAEMTAALYQVTIFDQKAIGDSRWRVFPGVGMDPRPYNVLARGRIFGNERQFAFLQGHGLFKYPKQYTNAESRCTLFLESSLTRLFTTMLAKSPADRPSAHQVLQFLKGPESIGKPCGGCLADEARGSQRRRDQPW